MEELEPMFIVDVIQHRNQHFTQTMVVTDRQPVFFCEEVRGGAWLEAHDSGFFSFFKYDRPSKAFQAFAGREFEIPMTDGSAIKAVGQWWDGTPHDYDGLLLRCGAKTAPLLNECNVFQSAKIDPDLIDAWLAGNEPSNNYHKYDTRSSDFGEHTITSKWD